MGPDSPQRILLPVRLSTVIASFIGALLLNFLPWPDLRVVPDFVALVLVFWCVRQPRMVGLGTAWVLGLLADAGNGVLLGQHALAYSMLAFFAMSLARRILWFSLWGQMLHVVLLLLGAAGVTVLVRLATGADFPGWAVLVGPVIGATLWPVVTYLLLLPQQRRVEAEEVL